MFERGTNLSNFRPLEAPHGHPAEDVVRALGIDTATGLSEREAADRLQKFGPNSFDTRVGLPMWRVLVRQFAGIVVWLLIAAAAVSWFTGSRLEAAAIFVVLVINAFIGFFVEARANRAIAALRKHTSTMARVRRNGLEITIDASGLVVGDVIALAAGDRVPADARLIEAPFLRVDESTFTGESVPVEKSIEPVGLSSILADRRSMVYMGTLLVGGRAAAVVTATGISTQLGRVGLLIEKTSDERTPLEIRLESLGRRLVYVVLGIALLVLLVGVLRGDAFFLMIEVSISLAVAAVPEALPAMTTLILALGVLEMARHKAIVRRLSAVETLGCTSVIWTDKTGTLTENRMTVTELRGPNGDLLRAPNVATDDQRFSDLLAVAVLCNDAQLGPNGKREDDTGDPTEIALLAAASDRDVDISEIRTNHEKVSEEPFDPASKRMLTVVRAKETGRSYAFLKGGPSAVKAMCSEVAFPEGPRELTDAGREELGSINDRMAQAGLRVLAFAIKPLENPSDSHDSGFTFLGFAGMEDPPRAGVVDAIDAAKTAGIRVVMLTGDQVLTAKTIAERLGIADDGEIAAVHSSDIASADDEYLRKTAATANVFARVSPADKLRVVEALQASGEIVAVTGDGINDAPALKRANIGVAMGQRGTEAAKEASDIVLADDNFSTIITAVEGGRRIYANIIKFVHLLFSHNLGEVIFIFTAMMAGLPLPLLPLQILWMNLVTDIFPALALVLEPAERDLMRRPPRSPDQSILSAGFLFLIGWQGAMLAAIALFAYVWAINVYGEGVHSRTVALFALISVQGGHLFNCRSRTRSAFQGVMRNPWVFLAVAFVVAIQMAALSIEPIPNILGIVTPNLQDLAVLAGCAVTPILITEVAKFFWRASRSRN
jgi:Ca2+-transporting ATPase